MTEQKYVLVEHSSAINTIIGDTFQTTQRIKFTAFDVSKKYIIFGANSGGIYIFTREPCQFFKLIPSTHGPTNFLQISPNEEDLAIAVSTGLVIVLEGCFTSQFEQHVFIEHEGNNVTAMKWNSSDLYCGDSVGRVSVITLKNFLTKAIFQTPVACLMHLDSQIVQLDTCGKFLLVSTQTRSLLCDTENEKYRQIGKKQRDGLYGACFLNSQDFFESGVGATRTWGTFTTLSDNEQWSQFVSDKVKIYCARPGVRLWQADFQGNVILTHQFRSSLPEKQSELIKWDDRDELRIRCFEGGGVWDNFNFGKLFPVLDRFVLTFKNKGFYIFEPSSSALQFWSNHFKNIKDIKVVDNFLYIWHNEMEVSVLSLLTIEELILRTLIRKQYTLCGDLCVKFFDEVESLLSSSKKIHLISALEENLKNPEVLLRLAPIFEKLKQLAKTPILEKIHNGIVTVNALPVIPETVQNFEIDPIKESLSILSEQFKVNKINKTIETSDFVQLVNNLDSRSLHDLIMKFQMELKDENCDSWCKEIFLKNIKDTDFSSTALDYACGAFLEINNCENLVCKCGFPLPRARQTVPKYHEIGYKLMEKSDSYDLFLNKVPYMHKYVLSRLETKDFQLKISLIIQFSDEEVIETHSNKMTYDIWDESMRLLLKLKAGQCLNCGSKLDATGSLKWTDFGILMVDSIKPTNAIKLIKRYSNFVPKGELDQFFYQYCILSAVTNVKSEMKKILDDENVQKQFDTSVGGYLRKRYSSGSDYYVPPAHKSVELDKCDHCQSPIKLPILEDKKLTCGHKYHEVCFLFNKGRCCVCEPAS